MQKKFFRGGFFFKSTLSVLRCTWTGRINLKIFLGYHINYLSIWPFMCHPWFPTRKASKLTFVCFQHQVLNTMQGLNNYEWMNRHPDRQMMIQGIIIFTSYINYICYLSSLISHLNLVNCIYSCFQQTGNSNTSHAWEIGIRVHSNWSFRKDFSP